MIKRFIYSTLTLAMLVSLTACFDSDDNGEVNSASFTDINIIARTTINGNFFFEGASAVSGTINFTDMTANLHFTGIKFAPQMPAIDFDLVGLQLMGSDVNHLGFVGTGLKPVEGYQVDDFRASLNREDYTIAISFKVNTGNATFDVLCYLPTLYSKLEGGNIDYADTPERFYRFVIEENREGVISEANLFIHNIQFVQQMPKQEQLRIPLTKCEIVKNGTGYHITGTNIIPFFKRGNVETGMEERLVDNFVLDINLISHTFNVEFDCYGLHFTDSGDLLLNI
ncbi:MAG: hypothetical protein IK092_03385 [Muribaculaceae bacterium]|nr:hypothetical protein [Muribaculaceae bacterium]